MNTDCSEWTVYVDKNVKGIDLDFEETQHLFELPLPVVGRIADEIRREKCGELVTFVIDRNISYTNRCVSSCKFCAFYARTKKESYVLSRDDILSKVKETVDVGGTQILIQGGLNPAIRIDWFEDLFAAIKREFPDVQLHSLSPPEIDFIARNEGLNVIETLERLREAGLDSLPGGGAEILSNRVRRVISPDKIGANRWIEVMAAAHCIGMKTTATMMFGHVETNEDIVEHLFRIRGLQNRTGGFTAFIPWTFQPKNTALYEMIKKPVSATRYLQVLAISRIVLHSIRNVQASWLTQDFEVDKLALFFGANDFGGTILEENVVTAAGKEHKPARVEEIVKAVESVGRPVAQRNTGYEVLGR
ncbi:MAG: Cyclic dehypoxanthine futalosine synthase [Candidatus Methanophagaceae archaeon]|nr:MAG: Cyclic dehypoxanthine futalosine synthase [Methanophagales archaeon]KAF5430578.1 cyclic dehypoxanthinyl futalosine synthase [Methanophagales archaeon]